MNHEAVISRRTALKGGLTLAAGLVASPWLAACGSDSADSRGRNATLRVGAMALATGITVSPLKSSPGVGALVLAQLYDPLVQLRGDKIVMRLATSVEPNADASTWTITVRDGVHFHNGKALTAADVAYSLQNLYDPRKSALVGALSAYIDLPNIKAIDQRRVQVPLTAPRGDFIETILATLSTVFPDGTTDFGKGIGSGPFRLKTLGTSAASLSANPDYWDGAPSIAGLEVSQINDETTRLNAISANQLDYAVNISATGAHLKGSDPDLTVHRGGPANSNALLFAMNQSAGPFTDPRVRRALRLAVDRKQLVDNVLSGMGTVGNDLVGMGLPGYPAGLAQHGHDPEQARSLLTAAGINTATMRAANLTPGLVDAAQIFAQQAKKSGLDLTIETADAASYFSDVRALRSLPFQAFYIINRPAAVHLALMTAQNSPFNFSGLGADYQTALTSAIKTVDADQRAGKFATLAHRLYESGGDIVWGFAEQLDASRAGIEGVTWSQSAPLFHKATVS